MVEQSTEKFTTLKNEYYKEMKIDKSKSTFITFKYMLPFRIPVNQGTFISFDKDDVLITFLHKEAKLSNDLHMDDGKYTVVECTSALNAKQGKKLISKKRKGKMNNQFTEIFDKQLNILNNVINIITLNFHYHNIYKLVIGHILSVPFYTIYNNEGHILNSGIFVLGIPDKIYNDQKSVLSSKQMKILTEGYYSHLNNPVEEVASNMRKSERAFYLCDYNTSIVNSQTSLEIFVSQIVGNYYRLKIQKNEEKIQNILSCGYKNLIDDHLIPLLEKMNVHSSEAIKNAINLYLKEFYNMRNGIVHNGETFKKVDAKNFRFIVSDIINMTVFGISKEPKDDFTEYIKTYFKINENFKIKEVADRYIEIE